MPATHEVLTTRNSHQVNNVDEDETFMPNYGSVSRHAVAASLGQACCLRGPKWPEAASTSRTWIDYRLSEFETLRFRTFVLPTCWFEQDATDPQTLRIFDTYDRDRRLLFGTARLDNAQANTIGCRVVLLSYVAPGSASPDTAAELREVYKSSLPKFDDGEDVLGTWHTWDLLNVMLVTRATAPRLEHRSQYERLGLGVIHCAALRTSDVSWEHVSLA